MSIHRNNSLDLETLGTDPKAVIVSIGAVFFDINGTYEEFYQPIDIESCEGKGLKIDASTIKWWMKQSPEAQAVFNDKTAKPLKEALLAFSAYLGQGKNVWGNGAAFDNVILNSSYRAMKIQTPWLPWNDKCYRTIDKGFKIETIVRTDVKHNALADAKYQAEKLIAICRHHGIEHILA